jgi:predicted AlkP superfamily pyrophosphatase or phosphodiesterase
MTHRTVVINVVGLTDSLIGDWSPRLQQFKRDGSMRMLRPSLPAVTTTVQSSMLTGKPPGGKDGHGIVANGWYNRDMAEVQFWKQSNHLVQQEKVWETARQRDRTATCANMFWWYNMYSSVDLSVTPRPMYKADGRKIPDCYSHPADLRDQLQATLGQFPLFHFWGPGADITSSQWIANASMIVHQQHDPTLMLIYLPHLDYDLQRFGPHDHRIHRAVTEIDQVVGELLDYFQQRNTRIIIVSEYGIEPVSDAVAINRVLREDGAVAIRTEEGLELMDAGASRAFAVADHQIAHVYVRDHTDVSHYAKLLSNVAGVEQVLTREDQKRFAIDHPRSGDLLLIAEAGRWFSYDYWLDDRCAPDYARTVDIHRKPGYDPRELLLDPALSLPKLRIARKVLAKKLGFRMLMDVIPLDAALVRGSHGRLPSQPHEHPVLLTQQPIKAEQDTLPCEAVRDVILNHMFEDDPSNM